MLGVEPMALKFHPQLVATESKPGQQFDLLMSLLAQPQVSRHRERLCGLEPSKVGKVLPAHSVGQLGAADQTLGPPNKPSFQVSLQ